MRPKIIFDREVDAVPGALRALRADLRASVQEFLPEDLTGDLLLAATEGFTNVIRHAYPAESPGRCSVQLSWDGPEMLLVIEDHGGHFDPAWCYLDHTKDESGRGFLIIRAVTDSFDCERSAAGGARLIMRKVIRHLDDAPSAGASVRADDRRNKAVGRTNRRAPLDDLADAGEP